MLPIILTILCACFFAYFIGTAIVTKKKKFPEVIYVLSLRMALSTGLITVTCLVLTILEFCKN